MRTSVSTVSRLLFVWLAMILGLGQIAGQDSRSSGKKTLALGVDYNDQVVHGYLGGYLYNEPKIRELIQTARKAGFDEIYWRVSVIGKVTYRSKVMTVLDGKGLPYTEASPIGLIMRQCDPLEVAIDECRKQGLKSFVYITLFDFAYPGFEDMFFEQHPEYWSRLAGVLADHLSTPLPGAKEAAEFSKSVSTGGYSKSLVEGERQGTAPYIKGVPSYGYPEVRNYLLSQIKELIEYRPDGIYLDAARTHAGIYPVLAYGWYPQWTQPYLKYGYNEPEIALYKKKYGKNPPLRGVTSLQNLEETEDEKNWNNVRGYFLTQLIRETSQLIHAAGMKLGVGFYSKTYNYFQPGYYTRQQVGRIEMQWKQWCDEGLVDVLRIMVDHRKHGYDDWEENASTNFKYAQDKGVKVLLDVSLSGVWDMLKNPPAPLPIKDRETYLRVLTDVTRKIVNSTADGAVYYEAGGNGEDVWNAIRTGAGRNPVEQ
ncbi:MAG TPA: hypothetical protein PLM33_01860 [Acidobacteriota bacterium]|nr:hypothetical protein [Acidobacteriota bacterium]